MDRERAADHEILTTWNRQYREPLERYVERNMPSLDAEDVVQDLFLKLTRRGRLSELVVSDVYFYRAVHNTALDRLRKDERRQARGHDVLDFDPLDEAAFTPDTELMGKQALGEVIDELSLLPDRTRNVFLMYHTSARSQKEVASELGIGLSTVEFHMTRATRHLRQISGELAA